MADEPITDEPDPLQALLMTHMARMQTITDDGYARSREISEDLVTKLKKNIGLRSAVVDKALATLGITEKETDES